MTKLGARGESTPPHSLLTINREKRAGISRVRRSSVIDIDGFFFLNSLLTQVVSIAYLFRVADAPHYFL